jgi:hypothetical protein
VEAELSSEVEKGWLRLHKLQIPINRIHTGRHMKYARNHKKVKNRSHQRSQVHEFASNKSCQLLNVVYQARTTCFLGCGFFVVTYFWKPVVAPMFSRSLTLVSLDPGKPLHARKMVYKRNCNVAPS